MDLEKAKDLFRQVVYRSRGASFPSAKTGLCGLGEKSPVFQGLPSEWAPLIGEIFAGKNRREDISGLLSSWLTEKDTLDRERNHFLKRFRNEHGSDRRKYTPATAQAFDDGLAEINSQEEARLTEHAQKLLNG